MAGKQRAVLTQKFTQEYVLIVFKDNIRKIAEIPLGTSEKEAKQTAQEIIDTIGEIDVFIDETQ